MTEKRYTVFKSEITGTYVLNDELHKNVFQGVDCAETILKVAGMLNQQEERIRELENENKQLRQGKYIYGIHGGSND